jgi:hypothetical protein
MMEDHMQRKIRFDEYLPGEFAVTLVLWVFAAFLLGLLFILPSAAQDHSQRTFQSAEEAGTAFFAAAQTENDEALLNILGPAGKELISSGDSIEDMDARVSFVVKYRQMHRYAKQLDSTTILYVGAENWPLPIPLVEKNGAWFFDTDAGKEEILMRRIGKNELAAIDACHQLVDAEKEYHAKALDGQHAYAERFVSDKGTHNGLSWSEAAGEFDDSVNPLIADAGQENTKPANDSAADDPIPFNGYYFRILTGQGKNVPGSEKSYFADGKMLNGFAFLGYPAEYRSSGVMTFIVNESGTVYEKDLGPDTTTLANEMTEYNPDSTWRRVN